MREPMINVPDLTMATIASYEYNIRGEKVMLDYDLAVIFGYTVKSMMRAVKRNIERFDSDFMFQLTDEEFSAVLRVTDLPDKIGLSKTHTNPYAFTVEGIFMLTTILKGDIVAKQCISFIDDLVKMENKYIAMHNGDLSCIDQLFKGEDYGVGAIIKAFHDPNNNNKN